MKSILAQDDSENIDFEFDGRSIFEVKFHSEKFTKREREKVIPRQTQRNLSQIKFPREKFLIFEFMFFQILRDFTSWANLTNRKCVQMS